MKKSTVSIIMAASVDGKITLSNYEKVKFTSEEDKNFLMKKRSESDCIVIGSNTIKKGGSPTISNLILKKSNQPLNVLISSNLNFNPKKLRYFNDPEIKRIIFTTKKSPIGKINELSNYSIIEVVKMDKKGMVDVGEVYNLLIRKYKCNKILIEGGGLLNKSFLEKEIVDDLYLTLCPLIISDTHSRSFIEGSNLELNDTKKLDLIDFRKNKFGEIFLHYRILGNKKIKWRKEGINWRPAN